MFIVGVLVVMLLFYCIGVIKVIDKFCMGVVVVIGGIMLFYLVDIGLCVFISI